MMDKLTFILAVQAFTDCCLILAVCLIVGEIRRGK